ncbi:unnamed protein product [Thlaspi arvense]|uniref:Uncharacterized protein n=1 Tax=Thlaspi arvense TaxID=13288 RepID=A0AAU9SYQ7_THLAR|nr:unnamed protein product [Thlaspi arvense]
MASSSSSSAVSVTREEFNAFHKLDRSLFTRLVLNLRRDISQSLQVMSFLLYLEQSALVRHLVVNLVSLPDFFINAVADEVVTCLNCMSYDDLSAFVAKLGQNINMFTIPLITRMTGEYLTLAVIHRDRESILLEMKRHLTRVCYPAFEDICLHAEMYNEKREKETSQFLCGQQETTNHVGGTNNVGAALISEDGQVTAEDRTIFLTFSRGYPISEAEVHAYFTRRYGEIIEAIEMGGKEGNEQVLYAKMVLRSAATIPEIVENGGDTRNKFTINGKHVWARKFIPRSSMNLLPPSYGVSP